METPNQNIKPITTKTNERGNLEIGGCDLVEVAKKHGTPLYLYCEKTIREMAKAYKDAFANYKKTNFMFASKAFMTKAIVQILSSEGFGFDTVSGGEMFTVKSVLGNLKTCLLNGNNKSEEELNMAIDNNIRLISVDNFLELAMLDRIAKSKNKTVDILLRITPGIECHTHKYIQTGHLDSKFGFDLTQLDEAIETIIQDYKNLNLKGLHAHIGSQIFETKVYYDEVRIILGEFRRIYDKFGIKLTEMNLGGGLGINYTKDDKAPSVYEIAKQILSSIEKYTKEYDLENPTICIEPGRSIVGTAGVTLYKVGTSKTIPLSHKKYVAVDGGMADNARPSLYQAIYEAQIANKKENYDIEHKEKITLSGRYCESGDILINAIELPKLSPKDLICVYDTGAYGYSMSSNYNRTLKPAVVLLNNGTSKEIVRRQTYNQLVENDVEL